MASNKSTKPPLKLPLETRFKLQIVALAGQFYIRRDGTVNRRILSFFDPKAPAPATKRMINPTTTVSTSDVTMDESRNLWFRLFVPRPSIKSHTNDKPMPLVVYVHGGGFTKFGPDSKSFDDLCCNISARANAVVASINYRLAPEHKYPSQYEDAFDALKFIDEQKDAVLPPNTDTSKCFVAGDSAGGNIAHHLTLRFCQKSNEFKKIKIAGVLLFEPFFGGEERTESEQRDFGYVINVELTDWMWRCFLPEGANRNHPAAHVFGGGANSDTAKVLKTVEFPRCLIVVGGYDPLQDWQRMYVKWLRDCGKQVELIEYPNAFHGVYGFPELPEHDLLIDEATNFIREQVA